MRRIGSNLFIEQLDELFAPASKISPSAGGSPRRPGASAGGRERGYDPVGWE